MEKRYYGGYMFGGQRREGRTRAFSPNANPELNRKNAATQKARAERPLLTIVSPPSPPPHFSEQTKTYGAEDHIPPVFGTRVSEREIVEPTAPEGAKETPSFTPIEPIPNSYSTPAQHTVPVSLDTGIPTIATPEHPSVSTPQPKRKLTLMDYWRYLNSPFPKKRLRLGLLTTLFPDSEMVRARKAQKAYIKIAAAPSARGIELMKVLKSIGTILGIGTAGISTGYVANLPNVSPELDAFLERNNSDGADMRAKIADARAGAKRAEATLLSRTEQFEQFLNRADALTEVLHDLRMNHDAQAYIQEYIDAYDAKGSEDREQRMTFAQEKLLAQGYSITPPTQTDTRFHIEPVHIAPETATPITDDLQRRISGNPLPVIRPGVGLFDYSNYKQPEVPPVIVPHAENTDPVSMPTPSAPRIYVSSGASPKVISDPKTVN